MSRLTPDIIGNTVLFGILLGVVATVLWTLLNMGRHHDVDNCYITMTYPSHTNPSAVYMLMADVPWEPNRLLHRAEGIDEVIEVAKKLNCEIK